MRVGYVDSSAIVAVALRETGGERMRRRLHGFDAVYSSNLLEAEVRSAFDREEADASLLDPLLSALSWLWPNRPLRAELVRVFGVGHLRGADAWHVACALFLRDRLGDLEFVSLDANQNVVARALGFAGAGVDPH